MSGVRVLNVPLGTTEKDIKIHFSNPKHGGRRLSRIYFPLQGNDAVLFFQDDTVSAKSFRGALQFKGNTIIVRDLPRKVFNKVTVELDQSITQHLDENPSFLDELQFDGDLEMTFDTDSMNYIMSGDWYQMEWALAYLDNVCDKTPHLNQLSKASDLKVQAGKTETEDNISWFTESGTDNSHNKQMKEINQKAPKDVVREFDFKSKIKSFPVSENKIGSGLWGDGTKSKPENIPLKAANSNISETFLNDSTESKQSFDNDLTKSLLTNYKPETKNLFAQRKKTGFNIPNKVRKSAPYDIDDDFDQESTGKSMSRDKSSEYYGSFGDDDWSVPEKAVCPPKRSSQGRYARRQKGMSVSHTDFNDIPLKLDITVGNVKILVTLGDIIEETTDAIVNPCSADLANTYGISKAIALAAGGDLQEECKKYISKKGHMVFGDVIHTCAGGTLNKRVGFVVHAAGPNWRDDESEQSTHILTCTYLNCFQYANKHLWLRSISLPLISAGAYGCPLDASVQAFYDALLLHVMDDKQSRHLKEIHLVSNDPDSTCSIIVVLRSLMDAIQEQARSAAVERYQKNSAQFEFSANQFDMFVAPKPEPIVSTSEDSDTESDLDETRKEANDSDIEESKKSQEKSKVSDVEHVEDMITEKRAHNPDDKSTKYTEDILNVEVDRNKTADDSDVSEDESSDNSDRDPVETKSKQIPEDDEVPMGLIHPSDFGEPSGNNMDDESLTNDKYEPQKEVRDRAPEIDKKTSDHTEKDTGGDNSDDDKKSADGGKGDQTKDKFVLEEPVDEASLN